MGLQELEYNKFDDNSALTLKKIIDGITISGTVAITGNVHISEVTPDLMLGTDFSAVFGTTAKFNEAVTYDYIRCAITNGYNFVDMVAPTGDGILAGNLDAMAVGAWIAGYDEDGSGNFDRIRGSAEKGLEVDLKSVDPDLMLGSDFSDVFGTGNVIDTNAIKTREQADIMLGTDFSDVFGTDNIINSNRIRTALGDGSGNFATVGQPNSDNVPATTYMLLTGTCGYVFDGTAWDRARGDSTNGALVNLGANNDVTVTGAALTALQLIDNIVEVEDTAHLSGDSGVMALVVRNDTLAALAGTDGDYAPLQVDADGALYNYITNTSIEHTHNASALTEGLIIGGRVQTGTPETLDDDDYGQLLIDTYGRAMLGANIDATYIGDIKFGEELPAGTQNIGDIDIVSTPKVSSANTSGSVTVGSTDTTVLASNGSRKAFIIVNDSDEVIYLNLSATAVMNQGIRLNANGGSFSDDIYTGEVSGICASGGKNVTVTEL